jgi:hypothetical protein
LHVQNLNNYCSILFFYLTHCVDSHFYFWFWHWDDLRMKLKFQLLLAFFKDVCPISTTSITTFSCWSIHLLHLDTLGTLFVLIEFCVVVARWGCCSSCVGRVVGWGRWSLYNLDLKLHFMILFCTLRCVVRQSTNSPTLVHSSMCYNAFFCISKVILSFISLNSNLHDVFGEENSLVWIVMGKGLMNFLGSCFNGIQSCVLMF